MTVATPQPDAPATQLGGRRWVALAVLSLSSFVITMDSLIVNVALPSFVRELGTTTRQLQWIVDAYLLTFTGLLLAAGTLGDRFGRRRILQIGLISFAATSAIAGSVDSSGGLIASRVLMGVGAALIFPATLALLTNIFVDPRERAFAIGLWTATSGAAVAAGPVIGGYLLEHFSWGSIFFVNLPVVAIALTGTALVVPESRQGEKARFDIGGVLLSIAAMTTIVYAIVQAPEWGWASLSTVGAMVLGLVLTATFVAWELRVDTPMFPIRIFRNLRFSAASLSITAAFFALFGFVFLITQYMQLVRSYSPLDAGLRTLPVAFSIAIASVVSPKLVERVGTTRVVTAGLLLMAISFAWISRISTVTPYIEIVGQMILLGAGLGMATAPATESIMGSVSGEQAGVGSAVNDTTRELGGTLGVAIIGSVFNSIYLSTLHGSALFATLPENARSVTEQSVGGASAIAGQLGPNAAPYLAMVQGAFVDGLAIACLVAAGVSVAGAAFAARFLPAYAPAA